VDLNSGILAIVCLFAIAGGGIVVVDALIIRKIRRVGPPRDERSNDHTIHE